MADGDDASRPACPHCGEPVRFSVISGPHAGSVGPCGRSVPPERLTDLED